eukprot:scaffold68055_cov16-Tisochrysis_lutea.AAC.1
MSTTSKGLPGISTHTGCERVGNTAVHYLSQVVSFPCVSDHVSTHRSSTQDSSLASFEPDAQQLPLSNSARGHKGYKGYKGNSARGHSAGSPAGQGQHLLKP